MPVIFTDSRPIARETAPRLGRSVQHHLGQMLGQAYERLRGDTVERDCRIALLSERFVEALSKWADKQDQKFRDEMLATLAPLNRFALSLTKNRAQADDLVQETLLKAWRSRQRFEMGTNLIGWLFMIMRNSFYTESRKHKNQSIAVHIGCNASLPEQQGALDLQDIQKALDKLSPDLRRALTLVAIENFSYEQVAEVTECKLGTVKSRVYRAREKLANIVGYNSDDLGADAETLAVLSGGGFHESGFEVA